MKKLSIKLGVITLLWVIILVNESMVFSDGRGIILSVLDKDSLYSKENIYTENRNVDIDEGELDDVEIADEDIPYDYFGSTDYSGEVIISDSTDVFAFLNETIPNTNYIENEIDLNSIEDSEIVNLIDVIPNIEVDLMNNHLELYQLGGEGDHIRSSPMMYETALLRAGTAKKLLLVNKYLIEKYNYRLRILEAYRPYDMQVILREHYMIINNLPSLDYPGTYIARPGKSNHQRGVAVDITLENIHTGRELEMPTSYLDLSSAAGAISMSNLTVDAERNLKILQEAMTKYNFDIYPSEWWHFNDMELRNKVTPIDVNPDTYFGN